METTNPISLQDVGKKMVDMVKQAITIIREEWHELVIEKKIGKDGKDDDLATNGDKRAQEMYVDTIRRCFPTFGIIAEEKELRIPCTEADYIAYFTVDPLDGTRAYERGQSHGVGTMLALVYDGEIVAVAIGDANSGDVYYYADWECAGGVCRERFGQLSLLRPDTRLLKEQYALLRESPHNQPAIINSILDFPDKKGLFKSFEIDSGSIGCFMARLWKGEVGAVVLRPGMIAPWDETPTIGITQRLGFCFFSINHEGNTLTEIVPHIATEIIKRQHGLLIVHNTHTKELAEWYKQYRKNYEHNSN